MGSSEQESIRKADSARSKAKTAAQPT